MSDETTAKVPASPAAAAVGGDHDRVVMASRKPDGTPDQTPNFEYIGDKETTLRATKEQLTQQAVSAVDVAERGVTSSDAAGDDKSGLPATGPQSDPTIAAIADKHEAAKDRAESAGAAEVEARFTNDPALGAESKSKRSTTADKSAARRETVADTDKPA